MPSLIDAIDRSKMALVADALAHYADALRSSGEVLTEQRATKGAEIVFARATEAEWLSTALNQETGRL